MAGPGRAWEALAEVDRLRRLNVEARGAHVDVHGWATPAVHVLARRRSGGWLDPGAVHVRRSPGRVYVEVERAQPPSLRGDLELLISAPEKAELMVEQYDGGVHVTGMNGRIFVDARGGPVYVEGGDNVSVDATSGPVEVRHAHGRVYVDTVGGSVLIEEAEGPVVVDTSSGAVRAVGVLGPLRVDTGGGGVQVERARGEVVIDTGHGDVHLADMFSPRITVDTGKGHISGDFSVLEHGYYRFESGEGEIRLFLPAGSSCEVAAESGRGTVRTNLPLRFQVQRPQKLRGLLGQGRAVVRVESERGDIVLWQKTLTAPPAGQAAGPDREHRRRQAELAILRLVAEGKAEPHEALRLLSALEQKPLDKA